MIVSIHQPAYLPWLGYLARIAASDVFVFLDTVQFEKNSFTNRNKIKTPKGPLWLTVPLLMTGHTQKILLDMEIDTKQLWQKKHLRSIETCYKKSDFFEDRFPSLNNLYETKFKSFSSMCFTHLEFWIQALGINTKIIRASELIVLGKKSDLILDICKSLGADCYISGPLGRGYLEENKFSVENIKIVYQEFEHPVYKQLYGDFIPGMGVVDYWFNCFDNSFFKGVRL